MLVGFPPYVLLNPFAMHVEENRESSPPESVPLEKHLFGVDASTGCAVEEGVSGGGSITRATSQPLQKMTKQCGTFHLACFEKRARKIKTPTCV